MQQHPGENARQDYCQHKGPTAMTESPNDDKPAFVAEKPVHCCACFRLIRPGQTYHLTIEHEVLCADCSGTCSSSHAPGRTCSEHISNG